METLARVEQLKAELDALRPIDSEAEGRIMQKFRLDWNYHSNNLEGNSLTYGETKALILFGITAQGKPLKDHFEITGHNEAINWVLDLVKGDTELTEVFIRQLHTLLLKESSYRDAQTPDGKPTRRKIEVGKYKTQPNHVLTVTGETFYFASPEETPAKMQELVEWFRNEKAKPDVNPIILAALFHYRFIRIHPFDDGNGRVARILMNFILMQFGYPPVIIKTDDKENYYRVLTLADSDQMEPFIEYIAVNLERSLEIMIRGANGEDIEEPEDLDKELALLERRFTKSGEHVQISWSKQTLSDILRLLMPRLLDNFVTMSQKFDRFYTDSNLVVRFVLEVEPSKIKYDNVYNKSLSSLDKSQVANLPKTLTDLALRKLGRISISEIVCLEMSYTYELFKSTGHNDRESHVAIEFNETNYGIVYGENEESTYKAYSETITDSEIVKIVRVVGNQHKDWIEKAVTGYDL